MLNLLARKTFLIPRAAEFVSKDELAKLIGHAPDKWLEVVLKELVDNALDDAEERGLAPFVEVTVNTEDCTIIVADQGSGIDPKTVAALTDLSVRVSSRAAYIAPSRGAQGNAWQTLVGVPYALDPEHPGDVVIEARGVRHRLCVEADPIERIPRVVHERERSTVKNGTIVTMRWPQQARSLMVEARGGFLSCAIDFTWLNPHLDLTVTWDGERLRNYEALESSWKKWLPSQPESPRWYSVEAMSDRIASEIAYAEKRGQTITVRDFVAQFRGLSSTVKRAEICAAVDASSLSLRDFLTRGRSAVVGLLAEMQAASAPVKPRDLGVIRRDNVETCMGQIDADLSTLQYRAAALDVDGMPYFIETAFAYRPNRKGPYMVTGLNFSPVIGGYPFRQLVNILTEQHVSADDPVALFVHVTCPRFTFTDKGKAAVELPDDVAIKTIELVEAVTAKWKKQYEAEIRTSSAALRRAERLARRRERGMSKKDAAYEVIEKAYMEASDNGRLPATARQVYYPSRRMMLPLIKEGEDVNDNDFTQRLLPDFMAAHPELTADWDVVFDDRGTATEPHTGRAIALGTIDVRDYLTRALDDPEASPVRLAEAFIETFGPKGRYGSVLFIEKEGFDPLMRAAGIRERFDVLTMSTKGYSNVASRRLVDTVCGELGLKLSVLLDFDRDGFGIRQTLIESGRRYNFDNEIRFIDFGLRLADVNRLSLDSEVYALGKVSPGAARAQLRRRGASAEEIAFLIDGAGVHDLRPDEEGRPHRVELNSMSSGQIVALIEEGLRAHGVTKIVPDAATLGRTFAAFQRERIARPVVERYLARLERVPIETPANLEAQVRAYLAEHPAEPWDIAVRKIVEGETQ
jgi:DNA topoisomerase VI subunit B